jgi:hypothetical protein
MKFKILRPGLPVAERPQRRIPGSEQQILKHRRHGEQRRLKQRGLYSNGSLRQMFRIPADGSTAAQIRIAPDLKRRS